LYALKILQITPRIPFPLNDGGNIAMWYNLRSLNQAGHNTYIAALNTNKHHQNPSDVSNIAKVYSVEINTDLKLRKVILNLFSSTPYVVSRFYSNEFANLLASLCEKEQFDIIQMEGIYLAPYIDIIRSVCDSLIVLRAHNIEHEIWERVSQNEESIAKKKYLELCTRRLKKFELAKMNKFDFLAAITQRDFDAFNQLGYKKDGCILPVGLDIKEYEPHYRNNKQISLCFIGSLDWMPNQDGLKWFLEKVWPIIYQKFPSLEFHVAGRNPPKWVFAKAGNGVIVHGEVPDAKTFLLSHPITVVPLLSGSGMRVKILESMALGRVVLTTRIGLEGIEARHQQEVLVGDAPTDFISLLEYCLSAPEHLQILAKNAKDFAFEKYDNIAIGKKVLQKVEEDNERRSLEERRSS